MSSFTNMVRAVLPQMVRVRALFVAFAFLICFAAAQTAQAQTTTFTYQGRLTDSTVTSPTSGTYDFQFALYDAAVGGTQQPNPNPVTLTRTGIQVSNGVLTTTLDFTASPFLTGADRYLEIRVKKPADANYVTLNPRQQLTSSPYSIRTLSAAAADALSNACVGCVTDGNISGGISGAKVDGATITGLNASNLASGTVPLPRLGTNTPTPTTFLRGDNTWATVSGGSSSGVTLQVSATNTAVQTITPFVNSGQTQNVSFNNYTAPAGNFDGTTFTATSAGTYLITTTVVPFDGINVGTIIQLAVNGTTVVYGTYDLSSSAGSNQNRFNSIVSFVLALNANDKVLIRGYSASTSAASTLSTNGTTRLAIVKLN